MKIVTVNVPERYLGAINKLIGENGLYPSRSELIRVAVRDFLLKELKMAKNRAKYDQPEEEAEEEVEEAFDEENFVKVPIDTVNEKSEPIREFKAYKILKSLNFDNSKDPEEVESTDKINNIETYDGIPYPSNYTHPTQEQLRNAYPNLPDFKFINERLF